MRPRDSTTTRRRRLPAIRTSLTSGRDGRLIGQIQTRPLRQVFSPPFSVLCLSFALLLLQKSTSDPSCLRLGQSIAPSPSPLSQLTCRQPIGRLRVLVGQLVSGTEEGVALGSTPRTSIITSPPLARARQWNAPLRRRLVMRAGGESRQPQLARSVPYTRRSAAQRASHSPGPTNCRPATWIHLINRPQIVP